MARRSYRREPYGKCEHLPVGQGMAGQAEAMAAQAVALHGVSFAFAGRFLRASETCYRDSPKLNYEKEQIADLLIGLTRARKT